MQESRSPAVVDRYFKYLDTCNPDRFMSKTTRLELLINRLVETRRNIPINKLSLLDLGCGSPEGSRRWSYREDDKYLPDLCVMAAKLGFRQVVGIDLFNPDPMNTYSNYPNLMFMQEDLRLKDWREVIEMFVSEHGKFDCIQSFGVFAPTVELLFPFKEDVAAFCREKLLSEEGFLYLT